MKYYKCWLENGKVLDFDKKCVEVNWLNDGAKMEHRSTVNPEKIQME
ncbi:MAG: hypothetical protein PHG07_09025 [Lachnospiraceae bacterium]|nr:hypothetical protein [Lachnospiraceae bacterium]